MLLFNKYVKFGGYFPFMNCMVINLTYEETQDYYHTVSPFHSPFYQIGKLSKYSLKN